MVIVLLSGYPDYLGAFFKLRSNNRKANRSWENMPFPAESYFDVLVRTHADKDIIACPVTITTTIATPTTFTVSSSTVVTGSESQVDLQAAIRQL